MHLAYLFLSLIPLMAVTGNLMVIVAVFRTPSLRNLANLFLVSLSVADLLVGTIVMPISIAYEVLGYWPLGQVMCDIWHILDILGCTASIWMLCAISLERCYSVSHPLHSKALAIRSTSLRYGLQIIGTVWGLSALLSLPAVAWWRIRSPEKYHIDSSCIFTNDTAYLMLSSSVSFFVPLVIMLIAYKRVYSAAAAYRKTMQDGIVKVLNEGCQLRRHQGYKYSDICNWSQAPAPVRVNYRNPFIDFRIYYEPFSEKRRIRTQQSFYRKLVHLAQEQKAAKIVGLLIGCFVICWLPFFLLNMLRQWLPFDSHTTLFTVVTWMGYSNSLLNPMLYSICNRQIRRAMFGCKDPNRPKYSSASTVNHRCCSEMSSDWKRVASVRLSSKQVQQAAAVKQQDNQIQSTMRTSL